MAVLSIQNHSIIPELRVDSKVQKNSLIITIAQESLNQFVDIIRVDRTIKNLVQEPSKLHTAKLFQDAFLVTLTIGSAHFLGIAFGVYVFALNVVFRAVSTIFGTANKDILSRLDFSYFPWSKMVKNVLIGIAATFPMRALADVLGDKIIAIMAQMGMPIVFGQDVGVLLSASGIFGILMMILGCVIAPIAEELLFRGVINDTFTIDSYDKKLQEDLSLENRVSTQSTLWDTAKNIWKRVWSENVPSAENPPKISDIRISGAISTWDKFITILKTSIIFGAMHLSPFQGLANIPIFIVISVIGFCFGLLAELTGDLWAPTTAHMLNNTLSTIALRG